MKYQIALFYTKTIKNFKLNDTFKAYSHQNIKISIYLIFIQYSIMHFYTARFMNKISKNLQKNCINLLQNKNIYLTLQCQGTRKGHRTIQTKTQCLTIKILRLWYFLEFSAHYSFSTSLTTSKSNKNLKKERFMSRS